MKVITIVPRDGQTITLGRCGENVASRLDFVIRSWVSGYADGNATLYVIPHGTTDGYFAATTYTNGVLSWVLTSTDLSAAGDGSMELHFTSTDGTYAKTCIFATQVLPTLTDTQQATMPQYVAPWGAKIEAGLAQIESARTACATNATQSAQSASSASASATSASQSATSASGSASSAQASAQSASASSASASQSAQTATSASSSASASASSAQSSAQSATQSAQQSTLAANAAVSAVGAIGTKKDEAIAALDEKLDESIESIESKRVSSVADVQAIVESIPDDVVELRKDVFQSTTISKHRDITVSEGQSIGYASGVQIYIDIPSGTSYTYRLDDQDGVFDANYALYECHAEGEDTKLYGNQRNVSFTKTSTADVVCFRIYVISASVKAGTVTLSVSYVRTNEDSLEASLKSDLTTKITKPEDAPSVGKVLRVKQVNDDGSFVCEWATGGSGGSTDVQINGTSITNDGVANIPYGSQTEYGVAKFVQANGLVANNGIPYVSDASDQNISRRDTLRTALMPKHINNIVKAALTDSNRITGLTSAEMDNACAVVGAERAKGEWVLKGTISGNADDRGNIDDGLTVDLTGCTQLAVIGWTVGTSTGNLMCKIDTNSRFLSLSLMTNGTRFLYARYCDGLYGIENTKHQIGGAKQPDRIYYDVYGFSLPQKNVAEINKIYIGNQANCTSCDIKIYAR